MSLYRTNDKKGRYLIAGSLLLFGSILLNTLSIINGAGIWTVMTEIGVSGEILCFSMGLAFRFKELKSEEEKIKQLQILDEFKNKFYTNITHEFRTPITVIRGITELTEEYLQKGDRHSLKKGMKTIKRNSNNLLALVNQMLDLTKLETNNMKLVLSQQNIVAILNIIVQSLNSLALQNRINLSFHSSEKEFLMDLDQEKIQTSL